jgi:multidrug efflux system outer membrane protein
MTLRRASLFVISLLLTGCMVGPNYQRPTIELPAAYPGGATGPSAADAVPANWGTLFNDPTLNGLIDTA